MAADVLTEPQVKQAILQHKEEFQRTQGWVPLNGSPVQVQVTLPDGTKGVQIIEGATFR